MVTSRQKLHVGDTFLLWEPKFLLWEPKNQTVALVGDEIGGCRMKPRCQLFERRH